MIWVYFIIAVVQSFVYVYQHNNGLKAKADFAFNVAFSITPTICVLVTLLYWVLLNDEALNLDYSFGLRFRGGAQHTLNAVIALVDLNFSSYILTFKQVIFPIVFVLFYQILVLIWFFAAQVWPYTFLASISGTSMGTFNWASTLAFVVGILFVTGLVFLGVYGLVEVREKVKVGREGRTRQPSAELPAVEENPYANL